MSATTSRARLLGVTLITALVVTLMPFATPPAAFAGPIADNDATYTLCGRVFPDPQAYWAPGVGEATPHPGSGTSPYAKGNAECGARTFMSYAEALRGLEYLDSRDDTGPFVELIDLTTTDDPRITAVLDEELGDGWSEGIQGPDGTLQQAPMYLVKVTAPPDKVLVDGVAPIAEDDRDHFVWSLSMHGIERAGVEGGVRAIEDLVTWGANEPERPLLETYDSAEIETMDGLTARNLTVGETLMRSVSYFTLSNPDGWLRGDYDRPGSSSFMRFNGNGMDLNRDWPELGWTDPSFTPWSESESRTYGKVLKNLTDNWTGGIDLHGMIMANAFSYTLVGGSQRPFDKNQRTMQFVEQAWDDAERRLLWSPIIKPNTAPEQCAEFSGSIPNGETHLPPDEQCDQRSYGVQYGTIWDTIEYTVTGAVGNWIDSPVGLNADGIDNEMMMSHLGNCGVGTCYLPEFEQLHVDGNKSLIYAMLNFELQPPPAEFELDGDVGYFVNPRRLVDPGVEVPQSPANAVAPEDLSGTGRPGSTPLATWTVDNAAGQTFVGGISAEGRWTSVLGESPGELNGLRVEYNHPEEGWTRRPTYSSGAGYRQAGSRSDWNYPADGEYRLMATGSVPAQVKWQINFSTGPVWEQPLQQPFDVSNMDFFRDLEPFIGDGGSLTAVDVNRVLGGERDLADFDTLVIADDTLLPGYREDESAAHQGVLDLPATGYTAAHRDAIAAELNSFVAGGGNLVLSDDGLRALEWMGVVADGAVGRSGVYAGHVAFTTDGGGNDTYSDPLATGIKRPGAAEGVMRRRQMVEPVPLGYELGSDQPQWWVNSGAFTGAGGRVVGTEESNQSENRVTLGEIGVGDGTVRIIGSFLPFPTTANYHPFGLGSYAVTDNGYIVAKNLWSHQNPGQNSAPNLADDQIEWVESGIPTRVGLDG